MGAEDCACKVYFSEILIVSVSLIALILNAEGKLLANETPILMVLVLLFLAGGAALNFVQIQRWRQQQVVNQASLEAAKNMIAEDRQRVRRNLRFWLIAAASLLCDWNIWRRTKALIDAYLCYRICDLRLQLRLVSLHENQAPLNTYSQTTPEQRRLCPERLLLGGGAEEEVGAGDAEEQIGCPGGEDSGEGVDVAKGFEDQSHDIIGDGEADGGRDTGE
jgi:type II secretory pathway pseudopilin PulG